MKRKELGLVVAMLIGSFLSAVLSEERSGVVDKETVLDRKVHIEKDLILDIPAAPRSCESMDISRQRVSVGDCELYCEHEGNGMPLVLVHGGPGATHHYFHPHFSRLKDSAKVIYYDQRGCGLSGYQEGEGYAIDQAVEDLEGLRKALKVDRWVVLGHSYGGLLAQCYALKYPERTAGLVLVGSATGMPVQLKPTRQYDFMSKEEIRKISAIHKNKDLSMEQRVYNAFLNGDWKRQCFYRPSRERIAQVALYEWKHDPTFRQSVCRDMQKVDLQGAFDECPIPTIIVEGKWDLTWNTDKPAKLRHNHPRARLAMFEHSSHSPFEDEPEKFFRALRDFIHHLPEVSDGDLSLWKEHAARWRKGKRKSPAYILRKHGWGRKSNEEIAKSYSKEWLEQLSDPSLLLKTGFALYDVGRYEEALAVFKKMSENVRGNDLLLAVSLVWQGHVLDLMARRKEAIAVYERAAGLNAHSSIGHDQFGMKYSPSAYAAERVQKPFTRVENLLND